MTAEHFSASWSVSKGANSDKWLKKGSDRVMVWVKELLLGPFGPDFILLIVRPTNIYHILIKSKHLWEAAPHYTYFVTFQDVQTRFFFPSWPALILDLKKKILDPSFLPKPRPSTRQTSSQQ